MSGARAPLRVVTVSGSLRDPSTTGALLAGVVDELGRHRAISSDGIRLAPLAGDLAASATSGEATDAVTAALRAVADADVLVVGTPVYRGSYTGVFKLFFDLVPQDALAGTPVLLTAGGGDDQHSLAIDHQLRPLFAFFRAAVLPVGVYARAADYTRDKRIDPDGALPARIRHAVASALPLLPRGSDDG